MLISELVAQLEKVKEQEGDLEIVVLDEYRAANAIYGLSIGYDDYQEFKDSKEECENECANKVVGVVLS